ncbi:MAG: solute carrier family 26 protein [Bacteroidota bacterium]
MSKVKLKNIFPLLRSTRSYDKVDFKDDFIAGLTVAVMLVPQGMAYALLAGLPPIYGLYAGIIPTLIYAIFGTSRQLSVGPVALVSILVLAGISKFAEPGSSEFIQLAILTGLLAGIIQLLLGVLRLGFLVNFLSVPVLSGFTSAAAIIIIFSQLKSLLGLSITNSNQVHEIVLNIYPQIVNTHLPTFSMGIAAITLMLGLKKINKRLPYPLIAVVLSILVVWIFGLEQSGIAILGAIPQGLPVFEVLEFDFNIIQQLLPLALTICMISFIESLAIAKNIEAKRKNYRILPNVELFALGISKIVGAFFQSYPTTGSFGRSALNEEAGAKTGISSIITALLIVLILLFLTPLFYYLPKAVLAAIIMVIVQRLIDFKEMKYLWKHDRKDFLTFLTTFLITLTVGIQLGILMGVFISIAQIIYKNAKPHVAILGRIPNTRHYRNVSRFPEAIQPSDTLIFRFDAQIYFGNTDFFRSKIEDLILQYSPTLKNLILDASSITDLDTSGVKMLNELLSDLEKKKINLCVADAIGPVRDILYKTGLMSKIGENHHFMHVSDAVAFFEGETVATFQEKCIMARQQNVD